MRVIAAPGLRRSRLTTGVLFCVCNLALRAQTAAPAAPDPVHWLAEAPSTPVEAGGRFQVTLRAAIDPGWHLYSLQQPEGGPLPTEIALALPAPADLLQVNEERPRRVADAQFHLTTAYFVQAARFSLRLQAKRAASPGMQRLAVLVQYQCCNDRVCLPPRQQKLEVPLRIALVKP